VARTPRYSDDYRASAVLMVEAEGYPKNKGALARVSGHLQIPERTLRRWVNGESNPPPDRAVNVKRIDLRAAITSELTAIFDELGKARGDASYKDLATAAGIFFDKLQLLNGEPTQTTNQRILVEYADDTDIVTQAAAVAERHYTDGTEI
jgi:transposase-like protein